MEEVQTKRIAIIGSTGSIGTQTLDIIDAFPHLFKAQVLTAHRNAKLLAEQALRFKPKSVVIADPAGFAWLKGELAPLGIEVHAGEEALAEAASRHDVDTVVTATVGYSGLAPTMAAIKAGKRVALANKETLVVAGQLIDKMLENSKSEIVPVDSEHSAIYQCLCGEDPATVRKLIITASGGPFLHHSADMLHGVTPADALRHPNWSMGAKITIDSATMMNKAFEIIEARWLFGIGIDRIEAVVHPQSIVHSMVEFTDGAIKAQLGTPDMHLPIRYALASAQRLQSSEPPLSLSQYSQLTFEKPDTKRFPCLNFATLALETGGNAPCVINAANEIAVEEFLAGRIRFTDIPRLIEQTLSTVDFEPELTLDAIVSTNEEARNVARSLASAVASLHGTFV